MCNNWTSAYKQTVLPYAVFHHFHHFTFHLFSLTNHAKSSIYISITLTIHSSFTPQLPLKSLILAAWPLMFIPGKRYHQIVPEDITLMITILPLCNALLYANALVNSAEKLKDHESSILNEVILTGHQKEVIF